MTRSRSFLVLFCSSVCLFAMGSSVASAQMEPEIPSLSQDQVARLNAGELITDVVDQEVAIGDVMGVVDHPPEAVMLLLADFGTHSEFMSDLTLSEVVGNEGEDMLLHGITDTPWPMDDREWVNRARGGATTLNGVEVGLATFDYVPGSGNIEDARGYWLALPWGDDGSKTLLRFRVQIDLGSWLPDFLKDWGTENFLPVKITDVRARLDVLAAQ